jgi:hypothetical protein
MQGIKLITPLSQLLSYIDLSSPSLWIWVAPAFIARPSEYQIWL